MEKNKKSSNKKGLLDTSEVTALVFGILMYLDTPE
jgi:hypothetical protein